MPKVPSRARHRVLLAPLVALACGPAEKAPPPDGDGRVLRTETDGFGLVTCSEATPTTTCYTHRAIVGVSMGANGAGNLGLSRPDLFDTVGMLGVPIVDWTYMLRNFERSYLGGFCSREQILARLDALNDPEGGAFCGPVRGEVKITEDGRMVEPDQDFNHWYRWVDEGRGGSFGRDKLRESFQDISLALGNPLFYNEASPYFPPGVPMDFRARSNEERCARPLVLEGLRHKEFNPTGEYPTIAFCDTRTSRGDFDPGRPSEVPMEIALAVDYDRDGIRDYAEPVITMMHERYEDVGVRPADDHDWDVRPTGTRGNWRHEEGEPFEDTGLDGVPGTGDFGEGNGRFDVNPNLANYFAQDPRRLLEGMPAGHLDRLNIYADAGIRDFLMSAPATNWLWGSLVARVGADQARDYTAFKSLYPGAVENNFDFLAVDYGPGGIGRHAYVRYGDPDASERDVRRGDGHHVGTAYQVVNRFLMSLAFIESRFLDPDRRLLESAGEITDLIQPQRFFSEALGRERPFGIVLPPGYNDPANADQRYPVVYFLHGQGMESQSLLASAILFFGYMAESTREENLARRRSDWAKFILVLPDSTCDQGACSSGNFNTDHLGVDGNGPRYATSLYELMAHVEKNFRVARPVEVPRAP